jgi:hypothetical protein
MNDQEKSMAVRELGKLGGRATRAKYGVEHYRKIGSIKKKKNAKKKHSDNPDN